MVLNVAGSNPVFRPILKLDAYASGFFVLLGFEWRLASICGALSLDKPAVPQREKTVKVALEGGR